MASHSKKLFLITFFSSLFTLACNEFAERPRNTLTLIGERTVLKCCSHDKNPLFSWKKYLEPGRAQKICEGGHHCPNNNTNYIIDKSTPGCSNLIIVSTSGQDSTYFECIRDGSKDRAAAYVIAYSCHVDNNEEIDFVEGDVVTFRCEVLWNGRPQFQSHWMNEHGKIMKWNNFTGGSFVSAWKVSLQTPELRPYTWVLQFLMKPNTDDEFDKTNASITWTSKREPVAYPIANIKASFQDNSRTQDMAESITCTADGYPSPDYLWLDSDGKELSSGPTLTIKFTETGQYKCVATNSIRGRQHSKSESVSIMASKQDVHQVSGTDVMSCVNLILSAIAVLLLSVLSYKLLINPMTQMNLQSVESQEKQLAKSTEVSKDGDTAGTTSNVHPHGSKELAYHSKKIRRGPYPDPEILKEESIERLLGAEDGRVVYMLERQADGAGSSPVSAPVAFTQAVMPYKPL